MCYIDTDGASPVRRSGGQLHHGCPAEQHLHDACPPCSVPSQLYLKISAISFLLQSRTRGSGRAQHLPPLASCPLRATLWRWSASPWVATRRGGLGKDTKG